MKAAPHLFPKQDALYPETGDFVAENGNKITCFLIQSILFLKVWTVTSCILLLDRKMCLS